jgi:hypothetical protein
VQTPGDAEGKSLKLARLLERFDDVITLSKNKKHAFARIDKDVECKYCKKHVVSCIQMNFAL